MTERSAMADKRRRRRQASMVCRPRSALCSSCSAHDFFNMFNYR